MPNPPLLLAVLEWTAPLFLLGCVGMGIPLMLHLLHRQRAPERPFSTLLFLRRSVAQTARRRRLRDLLLLALRMAFVGLLAVALAGPLLTGLARYGQRGTAVAIVLDNSLSMSLADGGEVRFDRAKALALELVDQLRDGDEAALVLTGGASRHQTSLYRELANVARLIETAEISFAATDIPATVQAAEQLLAGSRSTNRQIFLITDMQASGFRSLPAREAGKPAPLTELPLIIVDVHRGTPHNLAIESVEVAGTLPGVGMPVTIQAVVRNAGPAQREAQLELAVDGQLVQRSTPARLPAGARQAFAFDYTPAQAGIHTGLLQLPGQDACSADNSAAFVIDTQPALSVALVDQRREGEPAYRSASFYLERALRPQAQGAYVIELNPLRAELLGTEPLSSFAAVWCVDLRTPDAAAISALKQYASAGGTIVWVCGPNTDPASLNSSLAESGLSPGNLRLPTADEARGSHWNSLDATHPVLTQLDTPPSLYLGVTVDRYVALDRSADSSARVLAQLENGAPMLTVHALDRGQVWWLCCGAHANWTTLPLRPLFVPLVTRLVLQSALRAKGPLAIAAGVPAVIPLPDESEPVTVEFSVPQRPEPTRVTSAEVEGRQELPFDETDAPGIYRWRVVSGKRPVESAFAVNRDPAEADSATLDSDQLAASPTAKILLAHDSAELRLALSRLNTGRPLMDFFLIVVFICGIAELAVANRLGGQAPLATVPTARERIRAVLDRVANVHQIGQPADGRRGGRPSGREMTTPSRK